MLEETQVQGGDGPALRADSPKMVDKVGAGWTIVDTFLRSLFDV